MAFSNKQTKCCKKDKKSVEDPLDNIWEPCIGSTEKTEYSMVMITVTDSSNLEV